MYETMTRKDPDLAIPCTVSVVTDYEDFKAFKKLVGDQNVSKEIRAMIKDRVHLQKNEEPRCDPLGLNTYVSTHKSRQTSLFENIANHDKRNDIVNFIHSVKDTRILNQLEQNARCMLKVAEVQRKSIITLTTPQRNRRMM